jgi:hypothetical protein
MSWNMGDIFDALGVAAHVAALEDVRISVAPRSTRLEPRQPRKHGPFAGWRDATAAGAAAFRAQQGTTYLGETADIRPW